MAPVPAEFPMILQVENGDGRRLPLHQVPEIRPHSHRLHVDLSPEAFQAAGLDSPYDDEPGRNWVCYVVMFDPGRKDQDLTENTRFFERRLGQGEFRLETGVVDPAVSVFLVPLEDPDASFLLRSGKGSVRAFSDTQRSRDLLRAASSAVASLQETSTLDLDSNLGQKLLGELGIDFARSPMESLVALRAIGDRLQEAGLSRFAEETVKPFVFEALKSVARQALLSHLNVAGQVLQLFVFLHELQHRHDFRIYHFDASAVETVDGITRFRIPDEDRERIRLDENMEGRDGKDLRHVLAWHYRPAARGVQKIGLKRTGDNRFSLYLMDRAEATAVQPQPEIVVTGDSYEFEPSMSMSLVSFAAPLALDPRKRSEKVRVERLDHGRVRLSGLDTLWADGPDLSTCFCTTYAFQPLKSGFFTLRKGG